MDKIKWIEEEILQIYCLVKCWYSCMRNDMESWCYWACDVMCLCMGIGYTQYRYRFTLESSACALVCMCIVHVRRCFDTAFFLQLSTLIDIITKTTIYSSSKLFLFLPFLFTYTCNALLGFCCKKTDWLYTSLFGIFSFENEYSFFQSIWIFSEHRLTLFCCYHAPSFNVEAFSVVFRSQCIYWMHQIRNCLMKAMGKVSQQK